MCVWRFGFLSFKAWRRDPSFSISSWPSVLAVASETAGGPSTAISSSSKHCSWVSSSSGFTWAGSCSTPYLKNGIHKISRDLKSIWSLVCSLVFILQKLSNWKKPSYHFAFGRLIWLLASGRRGYWRWCWCIRPILQNSKMSSSLDCKHVYSYINLHVHVDLVH